MWEKIDDARENNSKTYRTKVPYGWMVKNDMLSISGMSTSLVFIPDTHHAWVPEQAQSTTQASKE